MVLTIYPHGVSSSHRSIRYGGLRDFPDEKPYFHSQASRPLRTAYNRVRPRSCVNGLAGLELVYLTKGKLPTAATRGKILTDTNCAADRNGISHCSNMIRIASGRELTVRQIPA